MKTIDRKKLIKFLSLIFISLSLAIPAISYAQQSLFSTADSFFSNDNEFLNVNEAFIFDFHQRKNKLQISFNIADGYYLYRHQFKFQTQNAQISDVALPKGEPYEDEFFGAQQIYTDDVAFTIIINEALKNARITITYQGCAKKGLCYPPTRKTLDLSMVEKATQTNNAKALSAVNNQPQSNTTSNSNTVLQAEQKPEQFQLADMLQNDNIWLTLIAFFTGGLLLSFTPCVFPMYPILTSIIAGQGKNLSSEKAFSLSFTYVQGMAITYTILGIVVALAGAQFQAMFQHPAVLVVLSILFIFLALSMFGVFNLALPTNWQNKLNQLSDNQKGGSYIGVLFMGIISGLVASPCTTAPLTAALLYISNSGDIILGASALYALSLGMGLPLLILGSSGGKLLPKAGNWMNVIKNIFGLLLLAVPIFLLERLVPEHIVAFMWSLLILTTAGYFYTVNQNTTKNFAFGVRSIVIFFLFFIGTSQLHDLIFPTTLTTKIEASSPVNEFIYVDTLSDLEAAVAQANSQGKTAMVDLYADWCIACKEFEKYTFHAENVQKALKNTVLLQIDLTDTGSKNSVEIMSRFEIFGLPSILFFNESGKELSDRRVTGFMDADKFTEHIKATF